MKKNTAKKAKRATDGERVALWYDKWQRPRAQEHVCDPNLSKQIDRAIRRAVREAWSASDEWYKELYNPYVTIGALGAIRSKLETRYGVKL